MSAATAPARMVNLWLIALTVIIAAFMEVFDTSIANVALPHIAGDLGASIGDAKGPKNNNRYKPVVWWLIV